MELSAGTRLGPYQIVRPIGAGGMGVVYRAKDTRLDRAVAVKVVPAALLGDPGRLRRFEQEARTIGGLNHPNLVILHDVGQHEGAPYLVTELLEGQSLRSKLTHGTTPAREVIRIALEIARGLAAAHGAGVVHRDIKPENIFVTGDGRVKILDFGIAKLKRDEGGKGDVGSAETIGGPEGTSATAAGVVIGTPGYMAPEQLSGAPDIDARCDVFAFGVVLFEMLARKRPFAADTPLEESYAIVKSEPAPLPETVNPALARIVMRCLEKRREARFQAAADLAFALEALDGRDPTPLPVTSWSGQQRAATAPTMEQPAGTGPQPKATSGEARAVTTATLTPTPASQATTAMGPVPGATTAAEPRRFPIVPMTAIIAGAAAAVAIAMVLHGAPPAPASTPPAATSAPSGAHAWPSLVEGGPTYHRVTYRTEQKWFARFSSDGKSVVYSTRREKETDYHVVRSGIGRASVAQIDGAIGRVLDISPSGELALRQRAPDSPGGLLVTLVEGAGSPRERAEEVHDAAYMGEELAIVRDRGPYMAIELPIGTEIKRFDGIALEFLRASHDGKLLAAVAHPIASDTRGYVVVIDRTGKELARSGEHPDVSGLAWSPDNSEVWLSSDAGLQALDLHGKERVLLRAPNDLQLRDVRPDGAILIAPRDSRVPAYLHHVGTPVDDDIGWLRSTISSISRDGTTIGMLDGTGVDETADGYALYVRRGKAAPVAIEHGFDIALVPDGSRAAILTRGTDKLRIVPTVARAAPAAAIPTGPVVQFDYSSKLEISGDGNSVLAIGNAAGQPGRVWSLPLDGKSPPQPIGPDKIDIQTDDTRPRYRFSVSPDGKWLALPAQKGIKLVPASGTGEPIELPGEKAEVPISFSADGDAVFVWPAHGWPRTIRRVEIAAPHKRTEVLPLDIPERPEHCDAAIDGSGTTIGFDWLVISSDLYVLTPQ